MNITFLGHAGFQFSLTGGTNLVVDPYITPNDKASDIDVDSLKADFILLTHGHGDHVADAERIANRQGSTIISNFEIVSWYEEKGIEGHGMNHGGSYDFDFGRVKCVVAHHSSVLPDGTYGGNPCGFVIMTTDKKFYIAGDTALTMDMKLIPMLCGQLDFVILPLGSNFTMDYTEAIKAAEFLECDDVIGCHFDTFEPIMIDREKVKDAFDEAGLKLILPEIGEKIQR